MGSAGARRRAGRIGSRARDSSGLVFVIFTRRSVGYFWIFWENRANSLRGQSDSDGALSSFSLFTFRYPSNDGVLRMVDSQGDYLIISKCNEELSPHHHSEAVRIGFLRIKRTVILADRPIFVHRDCVSRRASGGPSTSSDLTRQTHNSSRKWRRNPLRRRWMPSPTSTRRGPRTTPCSPRAGASSTPDTRCARAPRHRHP